MLSMDKIDISILSCFLRSSNIFIVNKKKYHSETELNMKLEFKDDIGEIESKILSAAGATIGLLGIIQGVCACKNKNADLMQKASAKTLTAATVIAIANLIAKLTNRN